MKRVDVALDLPRTRQLSVGMRAYAEELAARMARVAPDLRIETVVRTSALDRREQLDFALRLRRMRPRLVHHLSVYAPLLGPRPYVITIHDLIHLRFPAYFKRRVGPYYRTIVRTVAARAARVITDDERTIVDLERFLSVPPRKIRVVPLGVADVFRDASQPSGETNDAAPGGSTTNATPYFLYAGNRREHKNLGVLFAAWAALDPARCVDLCLTGDDDGDFGGARRPDRARGELRFLGECNAHELARWYRGATALVYPSLCEGFGLPMLEAAALGTPLVVSETAVPSVLRPYADIFAPHDHRALAHLMERHLERHLRVERDNSMRQAQRVALELTWDRCAARTAEVYREVLAESRRQ